MERQERGGWGGTTGQREAGGRSFKQREDGIGREEAEEGYLVHRWM